MINLFIITSSYPFGQGEQFLETEIEYWAKHPDFIITIFPQKNPGNPRTLPDGVSVDLCLTKFGFVLKIFSAIASWVSPMLIKEILWQVQNKKFSKRNLKAAQCLTKLIIRQYIVLKDKTKGVKSIMAFYNYWFDTSSYVTALLKRNKKVYFNFTRAHGFDLYESRRIENYMPLKRQFKYDFDKIFPISTHGLNYLADQYLIPYNNLLVSRLGVKMPDHFSKPNGQNYLKILSLSFCVEVKRIDKIIDALSLASKKIYPDMQIVWTHIGSGSLKPDLEKRANELLGGLDHLGFSFLGHIENHRVIEYLKSERIDVLINTSESEGIPVSIMEAMSFGIPAIAPAIGGIPEIINNNNGILLSECPSIEEISNAILQFDHYKKTSTRRLAVETISEYYNASKNYAQFICSIQQLIGSL